MAKLKLKYDFSDETDAPPNNYLYKRIDVFFIMMGLITYFADWVLDVCTAYSHYKHQSVNYFAMTVAFIIVPSIIMSGFSLYWYSSDWIHISKEGGGKMSSFSWIFRIVLTFFQFSLLLRYIDALWYGLRSRRAWSAGNTTLQKELYMHMLYQESDAVLLGQFECFLESAPQLVLQLYILLLMKEHDYGYFWVYLLWLGCFTSLFSLAWVLTAYARSSRYTSLTKKNISIPGSIVMLLWHAFSVASRVVPMALFASQFHVWIVVLCAAHWLAMTLWLVATRPFQEVCSNLFGELLYSLAFGAIYIFAFLNVRDEKTRSKYLFFYAVFEAENTAMVVLWLTYGSSSVWYYYAGPVLHYMCFLAGLACMLLYYGYFHPSLPQKGISCSSSHEVEVE